MPFKPFAHRLVSGLASTRIAAHLALVLVASPMVALAAQTAAAGAQEKSMSTSKEQRPRGKASGSGISFDEAVPNKIAAGQTVNVGITLRGASAAEGASVLVRNPATGQVLHSAALKAGETPSLQVPFSAPTEGVYYLDVITTQAGRTSVQQIAVKVGTSAAVQLQKSGREVLMPSGERIISMPSK